MTGDLTKRVRVADQDYLDWIRQKQCIVGYRCQGAVVPHHMETVGSGGSDHFTLPLCGWHHAEIHMIGERTMGDRYIVNWWYEVARLEERWWTKGDTMAEKKKVVPMKPFKAWVGVDKESGKFVHEGGIGLSRDDSASLVGERLVRVLVTEVKRGK